MSVITLNIVHAHDSNQGLFLDFERSSTLLAITDAIAQLTGVPLDMQRLHNLCAQHPSIDPSYQMDLLNETLEALGVQNHTVVRLEQRKAHGSASVSANGNNASDGENFDSDVVMNQGQEPPQQQEQEQEQPSENVMEEQGSNPSMQFQFGSNGNVEGNLNLREILAQPSVLPYFRDGPFDEAFDASKREKRILMAIVYSHRDGQSLQFITEVLTNETLMSLVEQNFILWCGNTEDQSAMQSLGYMIQRNPSLAQQLNMDATPATVLVSYIDNSISLIDVIYGYMEVDGMAAKLMTTLEVYGPLLENQRDGRVQQTAVSETQMLLSEQDQRYEEALQRDREMMEERKRREEREREAAQERELQKKRKITMLMQLNDSRSEMIKRIPLEPEKGALETTVLKFRLCDGSTAQRRFQLTDTLDTVFVWLDCNHHQHIYMITVPKGSDDSERQDMTDPDEHIDEAFIQKQMNGQFEISSTYPRKTYRWNEHGSMTLKEANLKSAQLFVAEL